MLRHHHGSMSMFSSTCSDLFPGQLPHIHLILWSETNTNQNIDDNARANEYVVYIIQTKLLQGK